MMAVASAEPYANTSLLTDNHTNTSSPNFTGRSLFLTLNQSVKALKTLNAKEKCIRAQVEVTK